MDIIPIVIIDDNDNIYRKIGNSIAKKYDCDVVFVMKDGRIEVTGDSECAREIAKEVLALFGKNNTEGAMPSSD